MATVKNLTLEMLLTFFYGLLYMLGVCHFNFGNIFNVKVFTVTVTVNVTVTLVRAIFQKMRNLGIFLFWVVSRPGPQASTSGALTWIQCKLGKQYL